MKKFLILGLLLVFSINFTVTGSVIVETGNIKLDQEISTDTIWDGETLNFNNESVIVSKDVNLTIINSHLNFNNFEDTGITVDGGILKVVNTTIEAGDKCINGATNGTVSISSSILTGCLGDTIELEGEYSLDVENSTFENNDGHGIDVTDISLLSVFNTEFYNLSKNAIAADRVIESELLDLHMNLLGDRGVRIEGDGILNADNITISNTASDGFRSDTIGIVNLSNLVISDAGGDGIQIENSINATLTNIEIIDSIEDGLKLEAIESLFADSISINNAGGDGIDLTLSEYTYFNNIDVDSAVDTGFEVDFVSTLIIETSVISNNGLFGMEFANISAVTVNTTIIKDNSDVGIYLDSINSFELYYSEIDTNIGGLEAINVTSAVAHWNSFLGNSEYSIDATEIGDGNTFDATLNYWGTINLEEIVVLGNVNINPILDENLDTLAPSETERDNLPFNFSSFLVGIIFIGIYHKRNS